MNIFYHKLFYIFFVNRINFKIIYPKKILFLVISSILLNSCSSEIKVQIVRPPVHKIEKIFFIEIGNFEFTEGEIFPPSHFDQGSSEKFSKNFNLLKPPITKFVSKENKNLKIIDLVRAKILHELSLNSPYKIYVKKNNKLGFSGIIPDNDKVAILNGKIKFFQKKIESKEELSYFTNIKNKGVTLQQTILSRTIAMGAEDSGLGFMVSTPYVESIAAIEVELSLTKKSDRSNIIPKQILHSFYTRKWGGNPNSSHLTKKIRVNIIKNFQKENEINETVLSRVNQAGLSLLEPTEYFARGFNLKNSPLVPKTSLDVQIKLAGQVAKTFLQLISPYFETTKLFVEDGNDAAATLIAGNAFLEAISILQGIDNRNSKDEYNLGLSFEAIGEINRANFYYKNAISKEPNEDLYQQAVKRTNK